MSAQQQDSDGATRVAYILGVPLAADVVRQWPQMGEIVRTRQLIAEVEGNFPELTLEVGRRHHLDDVVVVEWTCNYGDGRLYRNVTIGELEDGEVVRVTDYWGEPTATPEWRVPMTDRLDMPADGIWPDEPPQLVPPLARARTVHRARSTRSVGWGILASQLWRYPVKSLRGEAMQSASLTPDGIEGDRVVHVAGRRGPLTGRTRHGLLTLPAATGPDGVPMVEGHPWDSAEAAEAVRRHGWPGCSAGRRHHPRTVRHPEPARRHRRRGGALGADVRRLRPNIVLAGVPADLEPQLPGQALAIGDALIGVHSVRQRCIVTTIDPDTGEQDLDVLRRIRERLRWRARLERAGSSGQASFEVGDAVRIIPSPEVPDRIGGWIVGAPYPHVTA